MSVVKDVMSSAKGKLGDLQEGLHGGMEDGREKAIDILTDVRKAVRRNPGTAILVTLSVGVLLGLLIRPRRRTHVVGG